MSDPKSSLERIEETLRRLLADPAPAVRDAASASLDRLRAKKAAGAFLEKLRKGSVEERVRIVFAAEELGGQEGIALLLTALSDRDMEVRGAAVRSLEAFPTPPVLKALVARLPAEEGVVLGNLIESLGKSRRRELAPILEKYLDHADPEVRGKALVAYARVAEAPAWDRIAAQAGAGSEAVRAAVARALAEWSSLA